MAGTGGVTAEMFQAGIAEIKQCLTGISSKLEEIDYTLQSVERNIKYLQDYTLLGFALLGVFILLIGSVLILVAKYSMRRNKTASPLSRSEIQEIVRSEMRATVDEAVSRALSAKK